jgi:hypothetical protein
MKRARAARGTALACAIACAIIAPSAIAQRGVNPARDAFEQGIRALEAQRYVDALAAFEESYRLRPSPVALYNVAVAQRGLGRIRDAIATFERYLAAPERGIDRARLATIRSELDALRAQVVSLRLTLSPSTATLLVDGRPVTNATSNALELDPGRHIIEVSAEGYRTSRREVDLRPGSTVVLDVTLESLGLGRLVVQASVPTAVIRIDGREVGQGSVDRLIAPGEHEVEVRAPRFDPFRRTVRVTGDSVARLDATLSAEGATLRSWLIPTVIAASVVAIGATTAAVIVATAPPSPRAVAWGEFAIGP